MTLVLAGSIRALRDWTAPPGPVAVVGSAAAFRGLDVALEEVRQELGDVDLEWYSATTRADVEALSTVPEPAWWLLLEGSPLHARALWRHSALSERWRLAPGPVVAIGTSSTVLGDVMVDPRGGAPTSGVGLFRGRVISLALSESVETRTRQLLGTQNTLEILSVDELLVIEESPELLLGDGD